MSKAKRLVELIMAVNNKKQFTVQELADDFGVSYRTMLRDLQDLSELGVPLYSEVGMHGGYKIVKERFLPPIVFTEKEAIAIFFINQSLQYYGGLPFDIEWESIIRKFEHYLSGEVRNQLTKLKERVVFWNPDRKQSSDILQKLLEAALEQKVITVLYHSQNGARERKIQPIGLYSYNGYWYCPAFCFEKNDFRLFRADRLESVLSLNDGFPEPKDLTDISLFQWLMADENQGTSGNVLLRVELTPEGVRKFSPNLMYGDKIKLTESGRGEIITFIRKNEVQYCADLFFSLGKEARVYEPEEIIEKIREMLEETLELYN